MGNKNRVKISWKFKVGFFNFFFIFDKNVALYEASIWVEGFLKIHPHVH